MRAINTGSVGEPGSAAEETLFSARAFLHSLSDGSIPSGPEQLNAAFERVQYAYSEFPELELEFPRHTFAERIRQAAAGADEERELPILMFCAAIDPSKAAPVGLLLEKLARTPETLARIVPIIERGRTLGWPDIAPALAELRQAGRDDDINEFLGVALEHFRLFPDSGATELGVLLEEILIEKRDDEAAGEQEAERNQAGQIDPATLAAIAWSARRRLHRHGRQTPPISPPATSLLELAEKTLAALSAAKVSPPSPEPPQRLGWPNRRFHFAEFAAQLSGITGVAIEWLPAMLIGSAGARDGSIVRAKPGESGHLLFGPYARMPPGNYRVETRLEVQRVWDGFDQQTVIAVIEAVTDHATRFLAQRDLRAANWKDEVQVMSFALTAEVGASLAPPIEIRIWTPGLVPFNILSITVERI